MATKARFVKGTTESPLLYMLGVPYGVLLGDGFRLVLIDDLESGKLLLKDCVKQNFISDEDAQAAEKAMENNGLENREATFKKAREFQVAPGFPSSFNFRVCADADCLEPLVHGSIYNQDNMRMTPGGIDTLEEGFVLCDELAHRGGNYKLEAVRLFQQMTDADLPANELEWKKRYLALPEETRRKTEEAIAKNIMPAVFFIG